jgi:hypothetical protein
MDVRSTPSLVPLSTLANLFTSAIISFLSHPPLLSSADANEEDIIDEALNLFRANVLFRNFEIKGDADRLLIYLILYITECLNKLTKNPSLREAEKILGTLALSNFSIPGDATFPLNALYPTPANKMDAGKIQRRTCFIFFCRGRILAFVIPPN